MTRLDARTQAARDLARVNMILGAIGLDTPAFEFATPAEKTQFQAGLQRARREVTAAELKLHDLTFGVQVTA